MIIALSPCRRDEKLVLVRQGDSLILNGETFDFGPLADGAELPAAAIDSDWFVGPVHRLNGVLHLTLCLPRGANAPQETLFPEALNLSGDGPVTLPPYQVEEEI